MKRMTKMEAVGLLCSVKANLEREREYMTKRLQEEPANEHAIYLKERIEFVSRQIFAVEMAGAAMTR